MYVVCLDDKIIFPTVIIIITTPGKKLPVNFQKHL